MSQSNASDGRREQGRAGQVRDGRSDDFYDVDHGFIVGIDKTLDDKGEVVLDLEHVGTLLQQGAGAKLAQTGQITLDGDDSALKTFGGLMDTFDPNCPIVTP